MNSIKSLLDCELKKLPIEVWLHPFIYTHYQVKLREYVSCLQFEANVTWESSLDCREYLNCSQRFDQLFNDPYACHNTMYGNSSQDAHHHQSFVQYKECITHQKIRALRCLSKVTSACLNSTIRSVKAIRFSMDVMEELLTLVPDLKVIHYIRDPRGLALSRMKTGLLSQVSRHDMVTEARLYCDRVMHDLKIRQTLELRYPNTFMQLLYEDLAQNPQRATRQSYDFLGTPVPKEVPKWMHQMANASTDGAGFDTQRVNSSQTALNWRAILTESKVQSITSACADLVDTLGYPKG